ncbi:MAG TPA: hypothetical protein VGN11_00145, partial [Candidatus Baltobacteraceae bacterium]|nr:hypothetical protein [Candidatus Baltobacteraceae bacterium]
RRFSFRRSWLACALGAVAALLPALARPATVHGATDATVVWVSVPGAAPAAGEMAMRNRDRTFVPPFLVVPVGGSVRFPNDDPFYHSIYSDSSADPFDIGYYGTGPGKSVTFSKPGIIDVHCHIHAYMYATIIVADGPYAQADKGSYTLANVPAGKHILHAWDADRGERTIAIDVPNADANVTADIKAPAR